MCEEQTCASFDNLDFPTEDDNLQIYVPKATVGKLSLSSLLKSAYPFLFLTVSHCIQIERNKSVEVQLVIDGLAYKVYMPAQAKRFSGEIGKLSSGKRNNLLTLFIR